MPPSPARPTSRAVGAATPVLAALALAPVSAAQAPWPPPVAGGENPLIGTPYHQNGGHATGDARLSLWFKSGRGHPRTLNRRIDWRASLIGRLTNRATRRPVPGATVQIAQETATGWHVVARVRTSRRGGLRWRAPAGGTRRFLALYWPFLLSPGPIYSNPVAVRATPRIYLRAERGRQGRFRFVGLVTGAPIPAGGLVVAVQILNRGQWVAVRTPRTAITGRFVARYRFSALARGGRFRVRASVPGRQTGWPLYGGHSRSQTIRPR